MKLHLIGLIVLQFVQRVAAVAEPQDLFVPFAQAGVNNYRIPVLVATAKGTLIAIAEARTQQSDCGFKWLVARRSVDNGTTWSPIFNITGQDTPALATGNAQVVFDSVTNRIVLAYQAGKVNNCSPGIFTGTIDDGGSDGLAWGNVLNLNSALGKYAGATPGTSTRFTSLSSVQVAQCTNIRVGGLTTCTILSPPCRPR